MYAGQCRRFKCIFKCIIAELMAHCKYILYVCIVEWLDLQCECVLAHLSRIKQVHKTIHVLALS